MARPEKKFDNELFENLCMIQCTQYEICSVMNLTDKTLLKKIHKRYKLSFSDAYKRFTASGLMSLRRTQFRLAEKSAGMAIWLGKQYLNQVDRQEIDHNNVEPIVIVTDREEISVQPSPAQSFKH